MDKNATPIVRPSSSNNNGSLVSPINSGPISFWCPNCNDVREPVNEKAFEPKCKVCGKVVRKIQNPVFAPSVFPNFSPAPMQILDTDYELILVVPGKTGSLQFHFSLQRHYYPYLSTANARDGNSVVCKSVQLTELQRDMCDLGCCLPDLDWVTPPQKGASFLMKAKSQRVYKFDSLQNTAKHCFVIDGPGVLSDVDRRMFNLLAGIRQMEEGEGEMRTLQQKYQQCLAFLKPDQILGLVKAAGGDLQILGEVASAFKVTKKKPKDDDDLFMSMQPNFKDFGPPSAKKSSSGSESDSDSGSGYGSDW